MHFTMEFRQAKPGEGIEERGNFKEIFKTFHGVLELTALLSTLL